MIFVGRSALRRIWLNGAAKIFKLSQARHAFALIAMSCQNKDRRLRFWCPAYFCNNALEPLRKIDIEIVFYPVDRHMIPDWSACEKLAVNSPPDLFLLVHYFGSLNAIDQARNFCNQKRAKLIEDAAHFMSPVGGIGTVGDFVCYSPLKFFPVPDGGLLVVRDSEQAEKFQKIIGELPKTVPDPFQWTIKHFKRSLKRLLRRGARKAKVPRPINPWRLSPDPLMSNFSGQALEDAVRRQRIASIAGKHRQFESSVREILKNVDQVKEIEKIDGATSWMGLRCEDETTAQSILEHLHKFGISAFNWPRNLPPEVYSQENLSQALYLRSTTILVYGARRSRRRAKRRSGQPRHS